MAVLLFETLQPVANLIGPGSNPLVRLSSNIDDVSALRIWTPLVALSRTRYNRHFANSTRPCRQSRTTKVFLTHLAELSWTNCYQDFNIETRDTSSSLSLRTRIKKSRRVLSQDDRSETYVVSSSTFQNHLVSGQFRCKQAR